MTIPAKIVARIGEIGEPWGVPKSGFCTLGRVVPSKDIATCRSVMKERHQSAKSEHCCQQAHNIKVQQMLHFVLFDLWRFGSKCWTIYICYKHSVAAAFIMALIACWISFFREF